MPNENMLHVSFVRNWVNYLATDEDRQVKLPDRFIAKDKEGRNLIIVTYTYKGGTMGHGMGTEEGFELIATRICTETGNLINEDARIREEGFWIQKAGVSYA